MSGLLPAKRDGRGGRRRDPAHLSSDAIETAGYVHRAHRQARGAQGLEGPPSRALDWPRQAGAEDRVDDQGRAVETVWGEHLDRAGPEGCMVGGVAGELVGVAKQRHSDRPACGREVARGDETVAAVGAGPHSTVVVRSDQRAMTASATARPAASISSTPLTPPAAVRRSARAMSLGVKRTRSNGRRAVEMSRVALVSVDLRPGPAARSTSESTQGGPGGRVATSSAHLN